MKQLNELMTSEEIKTWEEIVSLCGHVDYVSINLATQKRRAVILKVASLIVDIGKTCESIGYSPTGGKVDVE